MYPMMTPTQMLSLTFRTGMMLMEAQMVIGMRMMGMMGLWRILPAETARMGLEKVAAVGEAAAAVSKAALTGKPPAFIAEVALKPIARRIRSNVKRLARRGPGKP